MSVLHLGASAAAPGSARPGDHHLCFGWAALAARRGAGLSASAWEDEFPDAAVAEATAASAAMAERWYEDDGKDFTLFDGVSLARPHRWMIWSLTIHPAVKFAVALKASLERRRPELLSCETSLSPLHRAIVEETHRAVGGFGLRWTESPPASGDSVAWTPPALRAKPSKVAATRLLNAALSAAGRARRGLPDFLASDYRSLGTTLHRPPPDESGRWVLLGFPPRRNIPGLLGGISEILLEPWTEPRWDEAGRLALDRIRDRWGALREKDSFQRRFAREGVALWPALRPTFDRFFASDLEPTAWARRGLENRWAAKPPRAVLLPYDVPPAESLAASVARAHGTPCAVLMHGLPLDLNSPFLNRDSSHFFSWTQEFAGRYRALDAGAPRGHEVTGNPAFDGYAGAAPPPPPTELRRVLVLTSPKENSLFLSSDADPERHLLEVLRALEAVAGLEVSVKLHPSESLEHYERVAASSPLKPRMLRDESIQDCLREADLVVGGFSTVMLEAMIMDRPLLCVNFSRNAYAAPFDGAWGVPTVRAVEELSSRVKEAAADAAALRRLREPYARILENFAGPLDGASGERVARALARLSAPASREAALR